MKRIILGLMMLSSVAAYAVESDHNEQSVAEQMKLPLVLSVQDAQALSETEQTYVYLGGQEQSLLLKLAEYDKAHKVASLNNSCLRILDGYAIVALPDMRNLLTDLSFFVELKKNEMDSSLIERAGFFMEECANNMQQLELSLNMASDEEADRVLMRSLYVSPSTLQELALKAEQNDLTRIVPVFRPEDKDNCD